MRTIEKKQIRIIDCDNASECEERVNRVLDELASRKPIIERDTNKPFCFYVTYIISEQIAESKSDEYMMDGINLYCQDCPHFVVPDDRRLSCRCAITHRTASASNYICDDGIDALETMDKLKRKGA